MFGYAITVTLLAGLSTALGGLVVLALRGKAQNLMGVSLGFAAGVMLTVSLSDMLPEAVAEYKEVYDKTGSALRAVSLFAVGALIALLLERCLPSEKELLLKKKSADKAGALAARSALVTMAVVTAHNLPEGVITLFTSYAAPQMGVTLALAIAMHNVPEGIAIAVPVYCATGSRIKAMGAALLSGLAEPLGALLAFWLLRGFLTQAFLTGLLSLIAGVMCCVSVTELLPDGFAQGDKGRAALGGMMGCLIMSLGIYLI